MIVVFSLNSTVQEIMNYKSSANDIVNNLILIFGIRHRILNSAKLVTGNIILLTTLQSFQELLGRWYYALLCMC